MGMFPEGAMPAVCPNFEFLGGLEPQNLRSDIILLLAPLLHPIAVRVEALLHSYTDTSTNVPENLLGIVTMSWAWHSRVAVPAHHVLGRPL